MIRFSCMAALMAVVAPTVTKPIANQPVPMIDLQRYAGQWHEIAHLPLYFQRNCVDRITATYTMRVDGSVDVRNACRGKDGRMQTSLGVAKAVDGTTGTLKVRFAPAWLGWLPWVWADYWVIELDPAYRWAVVGSPDRKHLWVLARAPSMDHVLFKQIKKRAHQRGYPTRSLIMAAPLD